MAAVKLGDKALGSIVKIKVYDTLRDFIAVAKNHYTANYVTLLLRAPFMAGAFGYSQTYNGSLLDTACTDFYEQTDPLIRNLIPSVYIISNYDALSRKIFIPSTKEVAGQKPYPSVGEGTQYQYFSDGGYLGWSDISVSNAAWLRTLSLSYSNCVWACRYDGSASDGFYVNQSIGIRPALNLPSSLLVLDDGTLTTNVAPSTPGSIVLPTDVFGGSEINVSWGASTDPDGNLAGYELDRTINGGTSWSNVYKGSALQTTNYIAMGTDSVAYRVRAYDTADAYSEYTMSGSKTVINNLAPSMPATLTVPATIRGGGQATISWSESTDPDGDDVTYELQKKEGDGTWEDLFDGDELSYLDTITRGITSIAYRVRAKDSRGAVSEYNTSQTKSVINNNPPVISAERSSGSDIGTIDEPFSFDYTVSDIDGDEVTVTEYIDDVVLREYVATLDETQTFDVTADRLLPVLNGEHELSISATDGFETVYYRLTFTKAVYKASATFESPLIPEEGSLINDGKISVCALAVTGSIPIDATYTVEVTNNALDDEPVWEDMTAQVKQGINHVFENETLANDPAFNFRVNVERGPSGLYGYIESVQGAFQ